MITDVLIVGCGVAGLYAALNLPENKNVIIITKDKAENSDSFLAQGGICVLREKDDYQSFYDDTMRAGHFENNPQSVDIMINSSRAVIEDLVGFGVRFQKNGNEFAYTREGAHSKPRILFHKDETGKEITSHLLAEVRKRKNVKLIENFTMVDLLVRDNNCFGVIGQDESGTFSPIFADYTMLATGGIGGLFEHSTNFPHLSGDALALSSKYGIKLKNIDYIQIHPTTLYTEKKGRAFLISESVRGEGAMLFNSKGERFVDELLPRDVVTKAIFEEMEREGSRNVWLSLENISQKDIKSHFPHIYEHCLNEGYDITKQSIPVVPAQHYFMGGIEVDSNSKTSMDRLYAIGETACNGVHGKNRLASNSLLESLVFAKRAAEHLTHNYECAEQVTEVSVNPSAYDGYAEKYKQTVLDLIKKENEING